MRGLLCKPSSSLPPFIARKFYLFYTLMKTAIFCFFILVSASISFAQHTLEIDDGAGNYGIIRSASSGGTSIYTFPPGSGTILVNSGGSSGAWLTTGNSLSGGTSSTPNEIFGSTNNYDVIVKTLGIERIRIGSGSALNALTVTPGASANTGVKVNGNAATAFGVSVDMNSIAVTTLGSSIFQGQINGASGANLYGGNVNIFSTNAAATGFGCTTSVNGTGNTNGVFASASSNGPGTLNGIFAGSSGLGPASGFVTGGTFFANGGASSLQSTGVNGSAFSTNASHAVGGSFAANGSTTVNVGLISNANGNGSSAAELLTGFATTNGTGPAEVINASAVANGAGFAQGLNIGAFANGPALGATGAGIAALSQSVATAANLTGLAVTADATAGAGSSGQALGVTISSRVNNDASSSTGMIINASGSTTSNTGIQINDNGATGPNQGLNLVVSGAGSTGINFSAAPVTGMNVSATTTGVNITAPLSINASGNIVTGADIKTSSLSGAAANKYAEQHTITALEIAGNTVTIANTIVTGATSVVVASLVNTAGGGLETVVQRVSAVAGSITITFDLAPAANDVVNYIVVNP
jgi:hypothetical protein